MTPIRPRRPQQSPPTFAHGWTRTAASPLESPPAAPPRRFAPAGTSVLLAVIVVAICVAGVVRVRASSRVLELGAEITSLTDRQARLQEQKRRLLAERAYLRHPDQVEDIARNKLGMVPVAPELVQEIRLVKPAP